MAYSLVTLAGTPMITADLLGHFGHLVQNAKHGKYRHIVFAGLLFLLSAAIAFLYEAIALEQAVAEDGYVAAIRNEKRGDHDVRVFGISAPSFGTQIQWQTLDRASDLEVGSRLQIVRSKLYFATGYRVGQKLDEFHVSFSMSVIAILTLTLGPPFLYLIQLVSGSGRSG